MDETLGRNPASAQPGNERNWLEQVHEGMGVYDRDGHAIGKVDMVRLSGISDTTNDRGLGPLTTSNSDTMMPNDAVVADVASVFASDHLPEELRERLLHKGFFRMDTKGLFASDRYVLPEQIARVSGDEVHLKASRDELIKR